MWIFSSEFVWDPRARRKYSCTHLLFHGITYHYLLLTSLKASRRESERNE